MLGIIGKKIGMTQIFMEDGKMIPVTVVQAGPCTVLQKKTNETDGYTSVKLGFEEKRTKSTNAAERASAKKANTTPKKISREFRVDEKELGSYELGQAVTLDSLYKQGDIIDVVGTTKGRGFTGVMKRHNFHGSDKAHGTHEYNRHGGSIGQHTQPGRTFKGVKMAGQYGNSRVTIQNLKIAQIQKDNNLILIEGAIPGSNGGYVLINKAVKRR